MRWGVLLATEIKKGYGIAPKQGIVCLGCWNRGNAFERRVTTLNEVRQAARKLIIEAKNGAKEANCKNVRGIA
jgi:hypothetical protein